MKKSDKRDEARTLRLAGKTYAEIAAELGVSKSSCSLWLRDLPHPNPRTLEHVQMMAERRWGPERRRRADARQAAVEEAAGEVGELSNRELLLIGTALYWAEGAKSKPWRHRDRLAFVNSDPDVIQLYLRWLTALGVDLGALGVRMMIHETADAAAARDFWATLVGLPAERFLSDTIKRHNPRTNRRFREGYVGCLVITVNGSRDLYRRMEGIWRGICGSDLLGRGPEMSQ